MKSFEEQIKRTLENYEAGYNPADWNVIEKKLNAVSLKGKITKGLFISATVVVVASLIYYFSGNEDKTLEKQNPVTVNTTEDSGIKISVNEPIEEKTVPVQEVIKSEKNTSTKIERRIVQEKNNSVEEKIIVPEKIEETKIETEQRKENPVQPAAVPNASFRASQTTVCANTSVQFTPDVIDASCTYQWNFGNGIISSQTTPKNTYREDGNYTVSLTVTSSDGKSDTKTLAMTIYPSPSSDFTWRLPVNSMNPSIQFEMNGEDITEQTWNFGDNQTSAETDPVHTYLKKGNYKVSLFAKNNFECNSTTYKQVAATESFNLLAPNAFSPNGDGKNDTWMPQALLDGDYIFTLTIIDRSGNIAFKTSSKNNQWNGHHIKTNHMVKAGETFTWIAVVKDKTETESQYGGTITIVDSY